MVVELALSGGLLVTAGFMIQSVIQISRFDYGVPTQNVFSARVGLFETSYPDSASRARFWRDLEQRLAAMPGHRGTALMTVLPGLSGWDQHLRGRRRNVSRRARLSGDTARGGHTRLVRHLPRERARGSAAGQRGRSRHPAGWPWCRAASCRSSTRASRPLGKRIRLGGATSRDPWLTIVGVIPEVWYDGTDEDNEALRTLVVTPIAQADFRFLSIAVAATGDPMAFAEPVNNAVRGIDADQPIYFVRTQAAALKDDNWFYAVFGALFAVFGAAALFLATVGVYGVMSFAVSRRTQEVGVRMALGAQRGDVLRLFMRQGGWQIAIGLLLSIGLAFGLSQGTKFVMFQVDVTNPLMYAGVSLALAITGLLAIFIPARRATKVDPLQALRYD